MRIVFVVGHPAHVHLFRNVIRLLSEAGHEVLVGAVEREVTVALLEEYGLPYFRFGKVRRELAQKALDLPNKELTLLRHVRSFGPDMIVSTGSPYAAHVSAILSKPHLAFGDTESAGIVTRLMLPFTDAVCTPQSFLMDLGPKHFRYAGYKELSYLHPNYYQPDPSTLRMAGLSAGEPYVVVRFASRDASHDLHDQGFRFITDDQRVAFVEAIEAHARVIVTADRPVGRALQSRQVSVPASRLHDILAYASLYVGEGATMAAEAGVLGVPWIFVSSTGRGFLSEQESRYGLGFWVITAEAALARSLNLLGDVELRQAWAARRQDMLSSTVDVARFIAGFIETWPKPVPMSSNTERAANRKGPGSSMGG